MYIKFQNFSSLQFIVGISSAKEYLELFQNFSSLQFIQKDIENKEEIKGFQNFSSLQFIAIFSSFMDL